MNIGKPLDFEFYNQRDSQILSVSEGYKKWSKAYNQLLPNFDLHLLEHSQYIKDKIENYSILDIGCGTGRIGTWLKKFHPLRLVGIDENESMLHYAKEQKVYDELLFADVMNYHFERNSFTGIISSLMLCHLQNAALFYQKIGKLVVRKSWVCIVDYHPYMLINGIPTRFLDPDTGKKYSIKNYIHSLSDHFNFGRENNLYLLEFYERYVDKEWADSSDSMSKHYGRPVSFMMIFEKH